MTTAYIPSAYHPPYLAPCRLNISAIPALQLTNVTIMLGPVELQVMRPYVDMYNYAGHSDLWIYGYVGMDLWIHDFTRDCSTPDMWLGGSQPRRSALHCNYLFIEPTPLCFPCLRRSCGPFWPLSSPVPILAWTSTRRPRPICKLSWH